jgi:polyphosphate kinase
MATTQQPHFFNRELSWIEFNQRVLAQATNASLPLLERLKFIAIVASNLDEFFMVRVGGLQMARREGRRRKDAAGLSPVAQLQRVNQRARQMFDDLYRCFNTDVSPRLGLAGIRHVPMDSLTSEQESTLFELFHEELFPVVTPIAVESGGPLPLLHNLALHMVVRLKSGEAARYAIMPLGRCGPRFIALPSESGHDFVLREEVVKKHIENWFPGYTVEECAIFRITRNAGVAVQEYEAPDLLTGMEEVLEGRKTSDCVRLEVEAGISRPLLKFLCANVPANPADVYGIDGVLNLADFMSMAFMPGFDELKVEAWPPQASPGILPNEPMFNQVARHDILLYHPYESFDPVVRFIEEASVDPDTMAIKMVLYRTSSGSPVISALKCAAENGVNVTVLIELKARFDEARNMGWALELEQSGAQVIYGVKGYKTHAKICLVVRRESAGVVRYCHFGTGNYNESTAKLYGDISYLTCNAELGEDASAFFNALCGYSQPQGFNLLSMAPIGMRDRLLELLDIEIERARKGKKAAVMAKFNALVDIALINKLYEASQAGVSIQLNVRGICCLRPGVKGLSTNIAVTSIVDRFLEHARIIYFHHGGKPKVFISSADWMPRNLDKRLELLVPVNDPACQARLIEILNIHMGDNESSSLLQPDGSYKCAEPDGKNPPLRSQRELYRQACNAIAEAAKTRRTRFEPHRAGGQGN